MEISKSVCGKFKYVSMLWNYCARGYFIVLMGMSPFCHAEIQYHGQMVPRGLSPSLGDWPGLKAQSALLLRHSSHVSFNYLSVVMLNYWRAWDFGFFFLFSLSPPVFSLLQHLHNKTFGHFLLKCFSFFFEKTMRLSPNIWNLQELFSLIPFYVQLVWNQPRFVINAVVCMCVHT